MTEKQVKWAKQHDWCIDAELLPDGSIEIIDGNYDAVRFKTFSALRTWAGY